MMSDAWLYLFLFLGVLGLCCAICAVVFVRAGSGDDDSTYGAPEGGWRDE